MDKPFLMNKQNFLYVPNTPAARKVLGDSAIEITFEQAKALDADRNAAGYEIMRVIVAEDNRRALAEAQARLAEATGQPAPAPVEAAPAPAPAEAEPDRPWEAKPIKGNPPKKELIAFLLDKGVEDAENLPYDELKAVAATYDWVAEHGDK